MDVPELTNFGSLVRYAVELEAATASFYRGAARLLGSGGPAEVAARLAEDHESRRVLLERTRQQKLNEMVLEPISGLDGARYVVDPSLGSATEIGTRAATLEQVAALFYRESAAIAESLLTEAARTFRRLGEANERNLVLIRETFVS